MTSPDRDPTWSELEREWTEFEQAPASKLVGFLGWINEEGDSAPPGGAVQDEGPR